MIGRTGGLAAIAMSLMLWGTGCVVTTTTSPNNVAPYQTCNAATDVCTGASTCVAANTAAAGYSATTFCTASCSAGTACPATSDGATPVCVILSGGSGQCYRPCSTGNTCAAGYTCSQLAGMTPFCVPNGAPSSTPPCGKVGQACCSGNSCTQDGTACAPSVNQCVLAPYAGCTNIGGTCASGTNAAGAVIATECQTPVVAGTRANGFCSTGCTAAMSECPKAVLPGFETRNYNCYILQGATGGQCMLDCNTDTSCPVGTQCNMVTTASGTQARVCIPPAA